MKYVKCHVEPYYIMYHIAVTMTECGCFDTDGWVS